MKKVSLLFFVVCFLFQSNAQEQILLLEEFNNGFPAGWASNPFQGNNQWFTTLNNGENINGSDMMMIQIESNQQSITELYLPGLPDPAPTIDIVMLGFKFNQRAEENTQLKVVQFDDQNPGVPIELVQLDLTSCDPFFIWSCGPDYFDVYIELTDFDPNDQYVLVYEDFTPIPGDFFALDDFFIFGFNNCPIGLILDTNFPPTCYNGDDGLLEVTGTLGQPPYSYQLDNGNPQASGQFMTTPGNHTITVTDALGCTRTYDFFVENAPAMSIQQTTFPPTCHNGNDAQVDVTASGGTPPYSYSLDAGPAQGNGTFQTTPGAHTITVTDANGCVQVFTVNVPNTLDMAINFVHTGALLCNGDNDGTLTVNSVSNGMPPYTYTLNGLAGGPTWNNLTAGNYTLIVTDSRPCAKTETFTITEPPVLSISVAAEDVSCNGANDGELTPTINGGVPPYEVRYDGGPWLAGATGLTGAVPGEYDIEARDQNLCTDDTGQFIDEPSPLVSDTVEVTASSGTDGAIDVETIGGNPGYFYLWSDGSTEQDLEDLGPGTYWLLTTDTKNCESDTLFVEVPALTATQDLFDQSIKILGNPVYNNLTLDLGSFAQNRNSELYLTDLNGRQVTEKIEIDGAITLTIPVAHLTAGLYFLQFRSANEIYTKKILITNR